MTHTHGGTAVPGGPPALDIGGDVGALVATMAPGAAGGELYLRSEGASPASARPDGESQGSVPTGVESHATVYTGAESQGSAPTGVESHATVHTGAESQGSVPTGVESHATVPTGAESQGSVPAGVESHATVHTGIWERRLGERTVTAAVFCELRAGAYWILDRTGTPIHRVEITGGELATVDLREFGEFQF